MILYLFLACGEVKSTDTSSDDIFSGEWTSQTTRDRLNEISSAICTQLSSCCSERSQEIYFYSYLSNVNLEDFHGQLPPNQTLSQEQCEELLPQMLDITWAGSWMKAIERGEVEFLAEEYTTCLNELQTSTCGEELRVHHNRSLDRGRERFGAGLGLLRGPQRYLGSGEAHDR